MSDHMAVLLVTVISIVGQLVNAWFNRGMRADLAEMREKLIEKLDGRYVAQPVFEAEVRRIDEKCAMHHAVGL